MIEAIKKAFLTGVGLATMSKDKIEEWAKTLANEAKMAEEEGKKFVDDILKQSDTSKKNVEEQITNITKKTIDSLGLNSKSEIKELKKKIAELEKKLRPIN